MDQTIHIKFKNVKIKCPNFRVRNTVAADLVLTGALEAKDVLDIKADIKTAVEKVLESAQTSEKTFGAVTGGSKSYQAAVSEIEKYFESTQVDSAIQDLYIQATVSQGIHLDWEDTTIEGSECEIANDIIIKVLASSMLQSQVNTALSLTSVTDYLSKLKNAQDSKTTNPLYKESAFIAIVAVVLLALIGYAVWKNRKKIAATAGVKT